jgi:AcrR family transcriptional regulator
MSAAPRTSDEAIGAAAMAIVAEEGPDGLSLRRVADAVGIKAPSLYKRFESRDALLIAVRRRILAALGAALQDARDHGPNAPSDRLARIARAWRAFARSRPGHYALAIGPGISSPFDSELSEALRPLRVTLAETVGSRSAPMAVRVIVSFLHGFVAIEASDVFRLADGSDAAFAVGVSALIDGLGVSTQPVVRVVPERGAASGAA